MTFFVISFLAGVLTVLAPCILPLLPIVLGTSVGARSKITPYIVIGSLAVSILLFTYLLKVSTAFISIPPQFWAYFSGGILALFGLILVFPKLWGSLPFVAKGSIGANKLMGTGAQKKSVWGDVIVGAALGPVFSTCSPTYLVILGTVLPASFFLGTLYLLAFLAGLVLILLAIAFLGQGLIAKLQIAADSHGVVKKIIGVVFLILGVSIMLGLDKQFETWVLDNTTFNVTTIEQSLLEFSEPEPKPTTQATPAGAASTGALAAVAPDWLTARFPNTDWSAFDARLAGALPGGPLKDGIPAIDNPQFLPINAFTDSSSTQAVVLIGETAVKVYPYNILTWHEIVNDTIDGQPVAVTFCPLCGSAITFDRTLPDGSVTTLGVSGGLFESNMIMYDRATESLWQQSTGAALAGTHYPGKLAVAPMQLMTVGDAKSQFPNAIILSENTGHIRDYDRNPYVGYNTDNERFIFAPSAYDTSLPAKEIMVVFNALDGTPTAIAWNQLRKAGTYKTTLVDANYTVTVADSQLTILANQTSIPFYFEMWFSFAVQHGDNGQLLDI